MRSLFWSFKLIHRCRLMHKAIMKNKNYWINAKIAIYYPFLIISIYQATPPWAGYNIGILKTHLRGSSPLPNSTYMRNSSGEQPPLSSSSSVIFFLKILKSTVYSLLVTFSLNLTAILLA